MILDSGDRTAFDSGAVRDMREGKGRCDLLPLKEICDLEGWTDNDHEPLRMIANFQKYGHIRFLQGAITYFEKFAEINHNTMLLELAIHFEEGAKKYGEDNWQKGIPVNNYIDSAIRHYLKWRRGDMDERHDRAFVWNLICAIWTCKNKPELNPYGRKNEDRK